MFEFLAENKSLYGIAFLIFGGIFFYLVRLKTRKKETSEQKIKNDLLSILIFQACFAWVIIALMPSSNILTKSVEVIEINSLENVETHLKNHYEDTRKIRRSLDDTIELTRTFVLVTGIILPFVFFKVIKRKYLKDSENKEEQI